MEIINKIKAFVDGKKTYVVVGLVLVGVILILLGVTIPPAVWVALGALGLGAVRSAIEKITVAIKEVAK